MRVIGQILSVFAIAVGVGLLQPRAAQAADSAFYVDPDNPRWDPAHPEREEIVEALDLLSGWYRDLMVVAAGAMGLDRLVQDPLHRGGRRDLVPRLRLRLRAGAFGTLRRGVASHQLAVTDRLATSDW